MTQTQCPNCNNSYKKLGSHWAHSSSCDYPKLEKQVKEIIQGILMGDGYIEEHGAHARLTVTQTNSEFLEWVDEKLGIISLGVKSYYTAEEHAERVANEGTLNVKEDHSFEQPYELKTRGHPYLKNLRSWYNSGEKRFPSDLELTPTKAKMWYCSDGSLIQSDKQRPHARFYTKNERDRMKLLVSYFKEQGLDARKYSGSVGFTADGTLELLEWMGKPPRGMEYKWVQ